MQVSYFRPKCKGKETGFSQREGVCVCHCLCSALVVAASSPRLVVSNVTVP